MALLPPTNSAVLLKDFSFSFGPDALKIIDNVSLEIPRGSAALLIGANGAGKSTLLRILAGKNLTRDPIRVLGKHPFFESTQGITYLGTEWAHNPIVRRDVPVSRLLKTLGAERYPDRTAKLLDIMDVNVDWHMHQVSDGQRRRVQIVLGLMQPWDILLLDEVTVDLDVLVRKDLIDFLKDEAKTRGATIIYATHIFDGLGGWPTHVIHIAEGKVDIVREIDGPTGFPELQEMRDAALAALASGKSSSSYEDNSALLRVVERWLREDYKYRARTSQRTNADGLLMTRWQMLSENMKEYGDKYFNYWKE